MQKNHKGKELVAVLETWYAEKKRSMPWRLNPTPYGCWLSEIMMQQTTYAAVLPYYERFLARFPSVESLAAADEAGKPPGRSLRRNGPRSRVSDPTPPRPSPAC